MRKFQFLYPLFLILLIVFLFTGVELPMPVTPRNNSLLPEKRDSAVQMPLARTLSNDRRLRRDWESQIEIINFYLEKNRKDFNLQPYHEFRPVSLSSPEGTFVKYEVYQDGIWIWGMDLQFQLDDKDEIIEKKINYKPIEKLYFNEKDFSDVASLLPNRYKVNPVVGPSKIIFTETQEPTLAYVVRAFEKQKQKSLQLIVRASDGLILKKLVNSGEF